MAFNRQVFKTRALTAIIFVAVMLTGLLWNQWSFLVLFSIIHFGCWWEYLRLIEKIYQTSFHFNAKMGLMLMGYGLMLWFCGPYYQVSGYSINANLSLPFSAAGFILLLMGIFQSEKIRITPFSLALGGLLYISLGWGLMINLYGISTIDPLLSEGNFLYRIYFPLVIIICMWVNDTMAYLVGSLIGKTPFSKISPKKTWEGTIGGILLSSVITGFIGYYYDGPSVFGKTIVFWIALAFLAAIIGTIGDLVKSKLKRMAGVKDSGNFMPGHGGFLDRFDSLLLATPFVWLYLYFLMR
jgi:phosphatidate cytidylyltransferase